MAQDATKVPANEIDDVIGDGIARRTSAIARCVPWAPDSVTSQCQRCRAQFSAVKRRHHCRLCGSCLCGTCTSDRASIPLVRAAHRICVDCRKLLANFDAQLKQTANGGEAEEGPDVAAVPSDLSLLGPPPDMAAAPPPKALDAVAPSDVPNSRSTLRSARSPPPVPYNLTFTQVWRSAVDTWPVYRSIVRYWLWHSVHCPIRSHLWQVMTSSARLARIEQGTYARLVDGSRKDKDKDKKKKTFLKKKNKKKSKPESKDPTAPGVLGAPDEEESTLAVIRRDVPRSMPNETFLAYFGEPGAVRNRKADFDKYVEARPRQHSLYRVLVAYSRYEHRVVSYAQGLNYLAGALLMCVHDVPRGPQSRGRHNVEREETALWLLVRILDTYGIGGLYRQDSPALHRCIQDFAATAKSELPKLNALLTEHLGEEWVHMIFTEWLTCIFTYNVSALCAARLWSVFLLEGGISVLVVFGINILAAIQSNLLTYANTPECDSQGLLFEVRRLVRRLSSQEILSESFPHSVRIAATANANVFVERTGEGGDDDAEKASGSAVQTLVGGAKQTLRKLGNLVPPFMRQESKKEKEEAAAAAKPPNAPKDPEDCAIM